MDCDVLLMLGTDFPTSSSIPRPSAKNGGRPYF
jgi:hypothetical protein